MSEITTEVLQEESERVQVYNNPFPGLRPFGIDESHLFFGLKSLLFQCGVWEVWGYY